MNNKYISGYIPKRYDIPIKNRNHLNHNNSYNDDFYYVIYYIHKKRIKIIIRRIDDECGWNQNLSITLYKIDSNEHQHIDIGKSTENFKITEFDTNIDLEPENLDYKQKIPKRIIHTGFNNKYKNLLHYNSIMSFLELNPEYEYYYFNDEQSRTFIKKNFKKEILDAYDLLVPGAYKADLFRYCYLYINGGCYFDCKMILLYPLRTIINSEDEYILVKDGDNKSIYNAVMLFNKRVENLLHLINHITNNVLNRVRASNDLELTGPKIICNFFNNYNFNLQHVLTGANYNNYKNYFVSEQNNLKRKILYKFFNGYYNDYLHTTNYKVLFDKNEVYYCNRYEIQNYVIYIYPHNTNDKFEFSFYDKNLLRIRRIDNDSGWGQNMKIKIINEDTNVEKKYDIGSIEFNNYIFLIDI
jgi:mannosyltransferase OCH1-like enzyme